MGLPSLEFFSWDRRAEIEREESLAPPSHRFSRAVQQGGVAKKVFLSPEEWEDVPDSAQSDTDTPSLEDVRQRRRELNVKIDELLKPLQPEERRVLRLAFQRGSSPATIAVLLNCNVRLVGLRISKVLAKARRLNAARS
jgi:DNA-directed RNA polymerase specialized sigma24 family protein